MPRGRYFCSYDERAGPAAWEEFSCAAGPLGWRYVATRTDIDDRPLGNVDLTLNGRGHQLRVELVSGGWRLRGGVDGTSVRWVRSPATGSAVAAPAGGGEERHERAHGFAARSPAFLIAAARLLRLSPGDRGRLRLVHVADPTLGTSVVEQGWELADVVHHSTDLGPLRHERYVVADLATGEQGEVHLAGDVVLAAPGVELDRLDSPPGSA